MPKTLVSKAHLFSKMYFHICGALKLQQFTCEFDRHVENRQLFLLEIVLNARSAKTEDIATVAMYYTYAIDILYQKIRGDTDRCYCQYRNHRLGIDYNPLEKKRYN